ncbi:membrane protein insertion efficiency factor YidD [Polaromonas sp. CG_9.11]|uniref:membrane protein insertion efficiency factor YidD n=1 Tax=Polaromonas sp. CG_9.11 TaxID=2787730 RepID=UPI000568F84B|nr:membrane protein insertion efficiency factor YidD [Polaromonas sp. CG_9.11]MBG6077962.1 putative membrane protein insertion efficiency factor [Polaromonas sp. CG_9.11]
MSRILTILKCLPQKSLMGLVTAYRLLISPSLGSNCRFQPSCSAYSLQALDQHGAATGSYLTLRRLARCHPWCDGGLDPVPPPQSASFFSRLFTPAASISSKKTPS